jgi:hypothetical protein
VTIWTGYGPVEVVHRTPPISSDERMHVMDDKATCWCRPWNEVVNRRLVVTHKDQSGPRSHA